MSEQTEQPVELPDERKCEALRFGNAAPLPCPRPANAGVNLGLISIKREKIQPSKEVSMQRGGRRSGAGRPKGAISLSTRAILEAAESGGEMPIAYMLRIMRDETVPDARRDSMAKAAAAYLHSRLSAIGNETDQGAESVGGET